MEFSPNLLKVLSCPLSGGKLTYNKTDNELVSEKSGLAYPIVDGIPILLLDKARKIPSIQNREQVHAEEFNELKNRQDSKVA